MKTERQIEKDFIKKLKELKYIYREDIRDKSALEANFKNHIERLNHVNLSPVEYSRLKDSIIKADVFSAAKALREMNTFHRDDGTPLQYALVNIKDWCKNEFEVVNQLRINTENSNRRYDVMLLINGIPIVQIELKSLTIAPKKAMEQIVDYKNDTGNGYANSLLCFIQIFVVSNETKTYYFANNPKEHFCFEADERFLPIYELADKENRKISNLYDFADDFMSKCTLAKLISRYMVLVASEQKLMIMRPYQIYAVKAIMDCIEQNRGNGYIWHTTGSGKTLTSFKASTLLKENLKIEKCLFVVDRKDLDRQTREEFNKFQEGCVEENTNTENLVKRLVSDDYSDKIIVTTIQKLGLALDENSKRNIAQRDRGKLTYRERLSELSDKRIVIIFDECHRSQFGENHDAIKEFFPNAQLFGFTGTPIFEENAAYKKIDGTIASLVTTASVFENQLHSYTITNAIEDETVLRFHVDFYGPDDKRIAAKAPETVRKQSIIKQILAVHDSATNGRRYNAIFATKSINDAIEYFGLFQTTQEERKIQEGDDFKPLNIACVFSPPAGGNKDVKQLQEDLPQEKADNENEPEKKKEALKNIIDCYNRQYGESFSINEFDLYYQDVQKRIKDQKYSNADYPHKNKIDITIVVDMLLTGFDSKYLNTLYVDKYLKYHGLIQAFSRTNRVLNATKPFGNILDFRCQRDEVDDAVMRFSGNDGENRAREIWLVDPAPVVVEKYEKAISELTQFMEAQGLDCRPDNVSNLKGKTAREGFIAKFKDVQRLKTQLDQYTDIEEDQAEKVEELLPTDTLRAFRGVYLDVAQRLKEEQGKNIEGGKSSDDLDYEFILLSSVVVDYDYIMLLIAKYTQTEPQKQTMTRNELVSMLRSYSNLMDEKEDIIEYINKLEPGKPLDESAIKTGYHNFKAAKQASERASIASKHGLEPDALQAFVERIIDRMAFDGEKLTDLLKPLGLGWRDRRRKEEALMEDLLPFLKKLANGREIMGLKAYE